MTRSRTNTSSEHKDATQITTNVHNNNNMNDVPGNPYNNNNNNETQNNNNNNNKMSPHAIKENNKKHQSIRDNFKYQDSSDDEEEGKNNHHHHHHRENSNRSNRETSHRDNNNNRENNNIRKKMYDREEKIQEEMENSSQRLYEKHQKYERHQAKKRMHYEAIRNALQFKILGDGGARLNMLYRRLKAADEHGRGLIDESQFIDILCMQLRSKHRPDKKEMEWLIERLRNRRGKIAYRELKDCILNDDLNDHRAMVWKNSAMGGFVNTTTNNYHNLNSYDVMNHTMGSSGGYYGPNKMGMTTIHPGMTNSPIYRHGGGGMGSPYAFENSSPVHHQHHMNMNMIPENTQQYGFTTTNMMNHNNQNAEWGYTGLAEPRWKIEHDEEDPEAWASSSGSVGEWLKYVACPQERKLFEDFLELVGDFEKRNGLEYNRGERNTGPGHIESNQNPDGVTIRLGSMLYAKLSFHINDDNL